MGSVKNLPQLPTSLGRQAFAQCLIYRNYPHADVEVPIEEPIEDQSLWAAFGATYMEKRPLELAMRKEKNFLGCQSNRLSLVWV